MSLWTSKEHYVYVEGHERFYQGSAESAAKLAQLHNDEVRELTQLPEMGPANLDKILLLQPA